MREFIKLAVEVEAARITQPLHERIRSLEAQLETRASAVPVPGPKGDPGKDGAPSTVPGPKGEPGAPGKDGIATREEIEAIVERKAADITVRTFADVYQGVFKPDTRYTRGLLTTWGGSLWLSLVDTSRKPGDNNADWKLVVKK
jgi:hypothetical protein